MDVLEIVFIVGFILWISLALLVKLNEELQNPFIGFTIIVGILALIIFVKDLFIFFEVRICK